jgi:hypothetical protein
VPLHLGQLLVTLITVYRRNQDILIKVYRDNLLDLIKGFPANLHGLVKDFPVSRCDRIKGFQVAAVDILIKGFQNLLVVSLLPSCCLLKSGLRLDLEGRSIQGLAIVHQ